MVSSTEFTNTHFRGRPPRGNEAWEDWRVSINCVQDSTRARKVRSTLWQSSDLISYTDDRAVSIGSVPRFVTLSTYERSALRKCASDRSRRLEWLLVLNVSVPDPYLGGNCWSFPRHTTRDSSGPSVVITALMRVCTGDSGDDPGAGLLTKHGRSALFYSFLQTLI